MADKILVFIPTYNCERQIGRVLAAFAEPKVAAAFAEILVLDNGSKDGTVAAAGAAAAALSGVPTMIARNHENYNLGGSHKSAFAYAVREGFSHVVVLHGDDQADIHDLLPVLERGDHRRNDCCLGSRFMPQSHITGYSLFRIVGNRVFNIIYSLATCRRIADLGSGLNMYATSFLRDGFYLRYHDGLHFSCCLMLGSLARKGRVMFFPVTWREEDQVSNVRLVRQAWQTFKLAIGYAFDRQHFFAAEHRAKSISHYDFDVLERRGS